MANNADVWQPRELLELSGDTKQVEERQVAISGQFFFTLTTFSYALSTGALEIYKNGLHLAVGVDWIENTSTTFSLSSACTLGDVIIAVGKVGITAAVDVRDTDIFIANIQTLRNYAGSEVTVYVQGTTTRADGGEGMFNKRTGAAPGTYVDNGVSIIVPTGGNGSAGWLRNAVDLSSNYSSVQVQANTDSAPLALAEYLEHARSQKPAAYSFPRLMRAFQTYRHDLQLAVNIGGFGSSVGVGATLPDAATQAPVAYFKTKFKATIDPGNLYNIVVSNQSVNGSTISESVAKLASVVSGGFTPKLCVLAYGMNDAQVAIYNAGQTFPAVYTSVMQFVNGARALGSDVILMTTPHHKTASGSTLYTMPNGIPQVYPTSVAANVPPESLLPPASASNISADFLGTGTNLTASHRHLRVNEAMRQAATDAGIPLIDVERYWFKAVAKYGEAALFNTGETVHPNLLGHQSSYWLAIDEFLEGVGWQTAQEGQEPRLNGNVGVNIDLPAAALDVHPAAGDSTSAPIKVHARIGATGGDGVKADCVVVRIDPANGDIVNSMARTTDSAELTYFRKHADVDGSGTVIAGMVDTVTIMSGMTYTTTHKGEYNKALGLTTIWTVPNNSEGTFYISTYNSGIGRQRVRIEWVATSGTLTMSSITTVGAAVLTGPTVSGLNIQVTFAANNTNYMSRLETVTGV